MSSAIPDEWFYADLGSHINIGRGFAFKSDDYRSKGIPIVRVTNIENDGRLSLLNNIVYIDRNEAESYSGYKLEADDVLIVMVGATVGKLAKVEKKYVGALLNQNMWRLFVKSKKNSSQEYLYHAIKPVVDKFLSTLQGSARGFLTQKGFALAEILLPPLPEQQKIATILSSVDDVIEKTRAQIDKLKDLKTGMMQELLTKGIGHTEFKDSPIGLVPAGWSVIELSNIVQKERPVTYGIVQTGPNSSNGVPCVRVVDLMKSELSTDNMIRTSQEISQQYKRTILQPGDIMFALRGEIGHVCKVEPVLEGANLTRGVALISPNQEVSTEYLLWALRSPGVRQNILDGVNGSALQEIPLGNLRSIKIPVPSIQEQNQIARTMDSIQSKLKEVSLKLDTVKSLKKALMQDLLTGKVRVKLTDKESAAR